MFEPHVLHLLRKYLGEYVHGLSNEALRISVWKGNVILKDLKLKAEALNSLKLPVIVKAGFVGTITLKVPWKSLGKEPVIVLIDRVFILAHPAPDVDHLKEEDMEKIFKAKLQQIEEVELTTLEAATRASKTGSPSTGSSWLSSLVATIIGNLKITISNVHIRYEDSVSNPGHPFCCGITLAKLAAFTMDEIGKETFDTSGALDKLRKSLHLHRLAVYHDSDSNPWKLHKKWEDLSPVEWTEIFADGIDVIDDDQATSSWAMNRKYLVSPINGVLKYHRLGKLERLNPEIPFEKVSVVLSDVSLTVLEVQYYDGIKLLETISRYKTRVEVSHLRPVLPVSKNPAIWWRYSVQASLQQKKMCIKFSWERIRHLCQLRRRYVQLYASSLQFIKVDNSEIRQIERDLDSKVIVLWRLLAHAKIESVKSKEVSQQSSLKRSWWSFGWSAPSGDPSISDNAVRSPFPEENFTKEEWKAINKMLSFEIDEETTARKEMHVMILFLIDVSIDHAAARIVSIDQTEILCGRFEHLNATTKLYHKSVQCDVLLRFCGLSAPEGTLAQSVSSEKKVNALAASFVHLPVGENVDWRLSAAIAPCHVTVFMESYERFLDFMKRSKAVSPTVALETTTALQMKLEKVTRRAQEQFQMVLEEQSRFALDIDLDAPKLRVPLGDCLHSSSDGNFLLDFGNFTLQTRDVERDEQRRSLYYRFYISGKDIAAFFKDGCPDNGKCSVMQVFDNQASSFSTFNERNFYSLIDRCRMSVIVDQIKVAHPMYPSTRISIEVPNLGIHFSPARYCRISDLLGILNGSRCAELDADGDIQTCLIPWYPADLASDVRVLVWRGFGNSLAEWQPCFLILSGLYLYVLESEVAQSYQRRCSMSGRHVFEVSPTSVGGSLFSIAVSFRGIDVQKALESSDTLIVEFPNDAEKSIWLKGLIQASYRASAPVALDILEKESSDLLKSHMPTNHEGTADLVINGALLETKLSLYGKLDRSLDGDYEILILELLASGGKVNLVRSDADLIAKIKLHSLKIKDELQGHISSSPRYLFCSLLKNEVSSTKSVCSALNKDVSFKIPPEDDDIYMDALPDFTSVPDQIFHVQNVNVVTNTNFNLDDMQHPIHVNSTDGMDYGKCLMSEVFFETEAIDCSDFVNVTFTTRSPDSPLYDGVDTLMSIQMSKLDFFFHRPNLVALIELGLDLSRVNSERQNGNEIYSSPPDSSHDEGRNEETGRSVIKGLLGCGKRRVVFHLSMDVDSVCVFLNVEDGSQLAMFVQERFLLDFKVHPSSISIEGSLGNMKLYDMSLGPNHHWGWLCDIRDQRVESLIKFNFKSYFKDDDDYEGHDYCLSGQLSAVRIVFLYRFVQEIIAYFMELATPHTVEVIKFVDKVGGLEWLIQKCEIDGAASFKLDLSLDTPIIIVPYNSMSKNFMQLDLGQLRVYNNFSWHGGECKNHSAVHLDILHVEIHGINMAVGIDGHLGRPMVGKVQGLEIIVRRSLRDIYRKVPTVSVEVKTGLLHCVMSDKEYSIILDCAYTNISEEPKIPPSFRINNFDSKDSIRMLVDKVHFNGQALLSGTVAIVSVEIQFALLELCNGPDEESPMAQISMEGLWVSYRYTSLSESDLYVTIPKFSILDIRPDVNAEMRLMLGSSSDVLKLDSSNFCHSCKDYSLNSCNYDCPGIIRTTTNTDIPNLTMLVVDIRWRSTSKSIVIRMQQPCVLVVLDFLLAVVEFFVPALRAITGRDETSDHKNDPIVRNDNIIPVEPIHMQRTELVLLSPKRQLIIDVPGFDEVIYDGCGGTLRLAECEIDDSSSSRLGPLIIIIGRGKSLRFRNVKIENGALLRKCTYLSCDSSYSVSRHDDVTISLKDSTFGEDDDAKEGGSQGSIKDQNAQNLNSDVALNQMHSFSFEAQIVSPEFTFYDSAKVSIDDSSPIEKLLRAKMDISFMYAAKYNDIWVRSLVKDLTVEAGSGLVLLDSVDISGAYTSVKDKTNISVISSDICIHLSLSVASLLLQLHQQAATALQFGNANPLASCTNFKKIWASQKGIMPDYNLTFWRPQAPSNYAILGDCVTSRTIPPTQVVMAISNTYGRVRKPLGFKLIGLFSDFQEVEDKEHQPDVKDECSLWMPLAPPGYSAVGCVVHIGSQPPPNHIVYCIHSDLVTSTTFSDCMFTVPTNSRLSSEFSIWRIDNAACSFYAHGSLGCPTKTVCFDLHQILLRNHDYDHSHTCKPNPDATAQHCQSDEVGSENSTNSSGWDVLRSYSNPNGCYISTPHFERIWWNRGFDHHRPMSIWRTVPRPGFSILGDCIVEGLEPPSLGVLFKYDLSEISARPAQFTKVAHINKKGLEDAYFWYPIAPSGYASLGCIVTKIEKAPDKDLICCPRVDIVSQANMSLTPISESSSKGSKWSIWKVENQACTFLARSDHKRPSSRLAFSISDHVKPKTRENISAEIKLGSFSLTILDGTYGTITPLFDVTVVNTNLATHGRLEAINAVLICSIAASTFNRELGAWEPLVESFDGIFKVETYDTNGDPGRVGKHVHVAATSTVNLNLSAGNLETLAESLVSWRIHTDLEQKFEDSGINLKSNVDPMFSALEEDDLRKVILENRLGCDLYLRKVDQSTETIELLPPNKHATISIPPPRFSDRLNVVNGYKEGRFYVAVKIFEAKELPILDDGNGHDFFCALRLVIDSNASDRHKLFPQSARTRSAKPFVSKIENLDKGTAKWNELFLFEIPEKGSATLELEITNLSSKAGKGEIIGALSIPIRNCASTLKRASSIRMLMAFGDKQHISSYSLKRRGHLDSGNHDYGILLMSTSFFDQNTILNAQREVDNSITTYGDIGFWVGGGSLGPWESFGSLLTLSVVPKSLNGKHFAFEVFTRNGKKHAVLRPLATVINDSDVKLEISVCPAAVINKQDLKTLRNVFAILNPGSSAVLPWSSISMDSELCLQVRPFCESLEVYYTWSQTFASNTAGDEIIINQGFFPKQSSMKHGNISISTSNLMLKQLEKKDVLLQCKSDVSVEQQFWLSARTDASALHPDINNPVYDWRITLTSPLRLENKLPYQAEYTIWEQTIKGNRVERQHGIISSEGSAFIYSMDLSRPIYLTFFVQDGWVLDQDAVLLMDISSSEYPSSFRMVQEQRKRKLHVSIERDLGGSIAAPKTIRFFVPYSINNDTGIPLSYHIVETDPFYSAEAESLSISKQSKSAKLALRHTPSFVDKKNPSFKRNVLEEIEDPTPSSIMLSPLDYMNRSSRSEPYISARVGIAIAACYSDHYSPGISLYELENKERVAIKAFASNDSYYKLSVAIIMESDRTKVVHFQPHTIFINKVGCRLCLKQCNTKHSEWFSPADPLRLFEWRFSAKNELLKLCMDGYKWSTDFTIETEGVMNVSLRNMINNKQMFVRVEVRSGVKNSRYEIVFRNATSTGPYRIENRSMFLSLYFRQVDGFNDSWQYLLPNSSVSFCWEDLGRQRLLEFLPDGTERSKSEKYNIDDVMDHQPNQLASGPMKNICVSVVKEGKMKICRISDWMPENQHFQSLNGCFSSSSSHISDCSSSSLDSELHVIFELAGLGLSIIDHIPEEILYFSVQNLLLSYSTGLGSGISRFKLRVRGIQVDNQLPFTPMPVLFRLQRVGVPGEYPEYILKFSLTMQRNNSLDLCICPYLDIQGPGDSAFLVNIHEPVIWRLHEMIQQANLSRIYVSQNSAVSVDPIIQIGYLNTSEVRFKVSMAMSPTQRPGGVLGFWLSLMTALGNMENMNIKINKRFRTDIYMRQSALISTAISNVQRDLLSQPLRLLSGVDILGNASSALGHMSKGVAALSMDRKFIQSRQKQENKGVEDIGDVIREGGGALAKGFFRGVTGILTKPLEGAKSSGMEGFVQGVGKGIIGAAAQPVSGVLDLLSKTTEGANAVRMKIASSITSEDQLLRKRLPRAIGADNLIKPFHEHGANGQAILQMAESGTFFGQVDLFKVRGKFALSDAYEDHFLLPEGKFLLVTHRRALLLQQPSNFVGQKKFNPARDPCSVTWDVLWDDLMTMALKHGTNDQQRSPPSFLILYLNRTIERENVRVLKCARESQQALKIYNSIEKAMMTYGPNRSKEIVKKVTKPYSPICNTPRENTSIKTNHEVPHLVSSKPAFSTILSQDQRGTNPHQ